MTCLRSHKRQVWDSYPELSDSSSSAPKHVEALEKINSQLEKLVPLSTTFFQVRRGDGDVCGPVSKAKKTLVTLDSLP